MSFTTSARPVERDREQALKIPPDLTEWVPPGQLGDWIMANVATLDWANAELMELLRDHPDFEPKALLNTLTYAYAVGILGAEEIARCCSSDPDFRAIRPKLPPSVLDLKQFRKENRGILKWTLVDVITRALQSQIVEGPSLERLPVGVRRFVVDNATERLDLARQIDRREDVM